MPADVMAQDSSLSSKVAMFNKQTQQHQQQQLLNPFSTANGRVSPKPTFSKDEYGKPLAGSLTEMRGQKANMHVLREMLELCQIIDSEGYNVKDEPKMRVIPFGELFNIYNYISDKVVGILLRARKHKLLDFEGEMLFQRRDDDVPVFLLKPIRDIRQELEAKIEEIKRVGSPAPQATSLLLDKSAHKQKLGSRSSTPSTSPARSKPPTPAPSKAPTPAQSKASTPEPADVAKLPVAPVTIGAVTAQPAIVNNTKATAPAVTITAAPAVEVTEAAEISEPIARLEGGQEAKTPANKDELPARIDITAAETEISVNQYTTPELEPVIAEHAGVPAAANNSNAIENAEVSTIVIETSGVHTRTLPTLQENAAAVVPVQAPTTVEASAAESVTEPAAGSNEAHPEE
ncbi:calphotin isoform X2 [Bactrocera oleae]|uniref:calphotin isoform X2 n=1 Tax=Bactrocera oleae TaxID=104688 RepID=UPI0006B6E608|nr:calphotin isoform X2 [Bactrocera oleae]